MYKYEQHNLKRKYTCINLFKTVDMYTSNEHIFVSVQMIIVYGISINLILNKNDLPWENFT